LASDTKSCSLSSLEGDRNTRTNCAIVTGFIVSEHGDDVVIGIGYKSEGYVSREEFNERGSQGQQQVPGDDRRESYPMAEMSLSKRQAGLEISLVQGPQRQQRGDVVRKVHRKDQRDARPAGHRHQRSGVYLPPASQVDLRRCAGR
jgi:ribosomal protein S1